ncbi:hypothetical protein DFH05DRAFT_1242656 [Lentinula detonsa]|uniref:7alpha-cephem-methoxylase P8 chain related protein n=1 Tax=Lentinula detonsa TaxID=2804962 RepID=A0A9W8NZ38_9AGAR|nr:hypothetical protein DFH05DRAFT_1242656 [Lentinula detonsa]KAJ3988651.1 hypothetical protein F5890DRAFT_1402659 [Lentinula detonsa]
MPATLIQPSTVPGKLLYFTPPKDGSRPITRINEDVKYGSRYNWIQEEHTVPIENIRGREGSYNLDSAGFQYYQHKSKHTSFSNDEEIEKEYYPESEELIKELTGASKVVLFDHTIRRRRPGELDSDPSKRQPVSNVHVDQTSKSAVDRVRRHLPESEAPELLKNRFQIINLWRPISNPAYDWPLTLCDFRSIDKDRDLVPIALLYPDREGETYGVKYNPEHKWKYLKGMTPEEIVLIKCYDSAEDRGVSDLTPHTAFEDPSTPEGSPFRESIELRALVFYN